MSKFDIILLFCFTLTVSVVGANFWLVYNGFEQFEAPFWTFLTAAVTGEIVMFSLYEIATKARMKTPRNIRAKHATLNDMATQDEEDENGNLSV